MRYYVVMATKAELEQQLAQAQAEIEKLSQQAQTKPVVVTARIPIGLRETMKETAMKNGENLQTFMIKAFEERLKRLSQ